MKASELRIGNLVYVYWIDAGRKVQTNYGVFFDWQEKSNKWLMNTTEKGYGVPFEIVSPIPLTEEWLLKFGFEKVKSGQFRNNYYVIDEAVFPDQSNHKRYNLKRINEMGSFSLNYIKDVHQLQNLYFALTGNELVFFNPFETK